MYLKNLVFFIILTLFTSCHKYVYVSNSNAMSPTIKKGDSVSISPGKYHTVSDIKRWDIIAFKCYSDLDKEDVYVKRVVGLQNEKITLQNDAIFINDKKIFIPANIKPFIAVGLQRENDVFMQDKWTVQIPSDSIFVIGDNARLSRDSRNYGFVHFKDVIGKVQDINSPEKP